MFEENKRRDLQTEDEYIGNSMEEKVREKIQRFESKHFNSKSTKFFGESCIYGQ